jgi:hypothetical protein
MLQQDVHTTTRTTSSLLMEYSELFHSLSGSHLNDCQVLSSRAASAKLEQRNDQRCRPMIIEEHVSFRVEDRQAAAKGKDYPVIVPTVDLF